MNSGSSQRAIGSGVDGSIDSIWGTVRPFAVSLRDVIMSHSSSTPSPIPSTDGTGTASPLIPSVQNRRAACTHLTMERLYGDYECMVCQRPSAWGWVYSCAQDDNEDEFDSTSDHQHSRPATTADLSPWIQKAIANGHYTEADVEQMVSQRQKVIDTISASEVHFKKMRSTGKRLSKRNSMTTSTSIDVNGHLPFPVVREVAASTPDIVIQSLDQFANAKPRIFPVCRYRACQLCRPTYRDRTWQILETTLKAQIMPPDIYDDDMDRPVSNVNVVRTIGIRKARAVRPALRAFDSLGIYRINAEGQLALKNGGTHRSAELSQFSADLADQRAEADSKGFRDSVKRAFKGMLISRKPESWSSKYSRKSTRHMDVSEGDGAEFDLGLWKEMSEELLREAAGIALPGQDGKDGLETQEDEVEVEDGVAVTEEAVDLGTADIIMSV
ncbi:MAG: hypothetical protein LQ343_004865 [Gyalolechia ehrenbergii]|nr:MAG: hypothetical protein LQ343_004865 [Gyalolechia ehrenbergii]